MAKLSGTVANTNMLINHMFFRLYLVFAYATFIGGGAKTISLAFEQLVPAICLAKSS